MPEQNNFVPFEELHTIDAEINIDDNPDVKNIDTPITPTNEETSILEVDSKLDERNKAIVDINANQLLDVMKKTSRKMEKNYNHLNYMFMHEEDISKAEQQARLNRDPDVLMRMDYDLGNVINYAFGLNKNQSQKFLDMLKEDRRVGRLSSKNIDEYGLDKALEAKKVYNELIARDGEGKLLYPLTYAAMMNPEAASAFRDDVDNLKHVEWIANSINADWGDKAATSFKSFTSGAMFGLVKASEALTKDLFPETSAYLNELSKSDSIQPVRPLYGTGYTGTAINVGGYAAVSAGLGMLLTPYASLAFMGGVQMGNTYDELIRSNVKHSTALKYSIPAGLAEGALEFFGINLLFKYFRRGAGLAQKNGVLTSAIKRFFHSGNAAERVALTQEAGGILGSALKSWGTEGSTEYMQNIANEVIRIMAESSDKDITFDEIVDRMVEAHGQGIEEAKAVALIPFLSAVGMAYTRYDASSKMTDYYKNVFGYSEVIDKSKNKDGVSSAADGMIHTQVWISPKKIEESFINEKMSEQEKVEGEQKLADFKKKMDKSENEWRDAKLRGDKLGFDSGEWAKNTYKTPLGEMTMGHHAPAKNAPTFVEASEAVKAAKGKIAEIYKEFSKTIARESLPSEAMSLVDEKRNQLVDSGFSEQKADLFAEFYSAFSIKTANMLGVDVTTYMKENPLNIKVTSEQIILEMKKRSDRKMAKEDAQVMLQEADLTEALDEIDDDIDIDDDDIDIEAGLQINNLAELGINPTEEELAEGLTLDQIFLKRYEESGLERAKKDEDYFDNVEYAQERPDFTKRKKTGSPDTMVEVNDKGVARKVKDNTRIDSDTKGATLPYYSDDFGLTGEEAEDAKARRARRFVEKRAKVENRNVFLGLKEGSSETLADWLSEDLSNIDLSNIKKGRSLVADNFIDSLQQMLASYSVKKGEQNVRIDGRKKMNYRHPFRVSMRRWILKNYKMAAQATNPELRLRLFSHVLGQKHGMTPAKTYLRIRQVLRDGQLDALASAVADDIAMVGAAFTVAEKQRVSIEDSISDYSKTPNSPLRANFRKWLIKNIDKVPANKTSDTELVTDLFAEYLADVGVVENYNEGIQVLFDFFADDNLELNENADTKAMTRDVNAIAGMFLQRESGDILGAIEIFENGAQIHLSPKADVSTIVHETFHFFLNEMFKVYDSGKANAQVRKDVEILREYAGEFNEQGIEKLAKAFETYVKEGKAPSKRLLVAFRRAAKWFKDLIAKALWSGIELNDDVRGVYSRMLASELEINEINADNSIQFMLSQLNSQNASTARARANFDGANAAAISKLTESLFKEEIALDSPEAKTRINKIATEIVSQRKVYKAVAAINKQGGLSLNSLKENTELDDSEIKALKDKFGVSFVIPTGITFPLAFLTTEGYSDYQSLLTALGEAPSMSVAIDEASEMIKADMVSQNSVEAALRAQHDSNMILTLEQSLQSLLSDLRKIKFSEVLGEDYDLFASHDKVVGDSDLVAKVMHLRLLQSNLDEINNAIDENSENVVNVKERMRQYGYEVTGLPLAIIAEHENGSSIDDIVSRTYLEIGSMTIEEYAKENGLSAKEIVTDALAMGTYDDVYAALKEQAKQESMELLSNEVFTDEFFEYVSENASQELVARALDGATSISRFDDILAIFTLMVNETMEQLNVGEDMSLEMANAITQVDRLMPQDSEFTYAAAAKAAAKEHIEQGVSYDKALNPMIYAKAEELLMNDASNAIANGEVEKATELLEKAIANHAMVSESFKVKNEYNAMRDYITGEDFWSKMDTMSVSEHDAIVALLSGYSMTMGEPLAYRSAENSAEAFANVKNFAEDQTSIYLKNIINSIPEKMEALETTNDYLSFGDMREVYDVVRALVRRGVGELKALDGNYLGATTIDELGDGLADELLNNTSDTPLFGKNPESVGNKLVNSINDVAMGAMKLRTIADIIDGTPMFSGKGVGTFKSLVQRGETLNAHYNERKNTMLSEARVLMKSILDSEDKAELDAAYAKKQMQNGIIGKAGTLVNREFYEGLDIDRGTYMKKHNLEWTFDRLIGVLLLMGSKDGVKKLTHSRGHGFSQETLDKIDALFGEKVHKAIDQILEIESSLFNELNDVYHSQTGATLKKVEYNPRTVITKSGREITLKGGYHRLYYLQPDSRSMTPESQTGLLTEEKDIRSNVEPSPASGSRHERNEEFIAPPVLSYNVVARSIQENLHDIIHSEYVYEMRDLLNHKRFREAVTERLGKGAINAMDAAIRNVATLHNENPETMSGLVKVFNWSRKQASKLILGGNFGIALKQRLSAINGINAISRGGKNTTKHLYAAAADLGVRSAVYGDVTGSFAEKMLSKSVPLKTRADSFDINITDIRKGSNFIPRSFTLGGKTFTASDARELLFALIRSQDMATTTLIWTTAYKQAMAGDVEFKESIINRGITADMSDIEKIAIQDENMENLSREYADSIVSDTQPTSAPINLSEWQTNDILKLFSSFLTYQNVFGNTLMKNIAAVRHGQISGKDFAYNMAKEVFLPQFTMLSFATLIYSGMSEPEPIDWFRDPMFGMFGFVPGLNSALAAFTYGESAMAIPAFSVPFNIFNNVAEEPDNVLAWSYSLLRFAEYFTGIPLSNPAKEMLATHKKIIDVKNE